MLSHDALALGLGLPRAKVAVAFVLLELKIEWLRRPKVHHPRLRDARVAQWTNLEFMFVALVLTQRTESLRLVGTDTNRNGAISPSESAFKIGPRGLNLEVLSANLRGRVGEHPSPFDQRVERFAAA